MAIDTKEKRAGVLGVGRPWVRDKFPVATPDEEWRISSGNAYGGNALSSIVVTPSPALCLPLTVTIVNSGRTTLDISAAWKTTVDLSSNGTTTITPACVTSPTSPTLAMAFTGGHLTTPDFINLGSVFSIVMDVKTSSSTQSGLMSQYTTTGGKRSFRLLMSSMGRLGIYLSANGIAANFYTTTGSPINNGSWHTIAIVYASSVVKFYLDGTLIKTLGTTESSVFNTDALIGIATGFNSGSELLTGSLSDILLYSDELTAGEVNFLSGLSGDDPGAANLIWSLPLDGDTNDAVGTNHATLSGSATYEDK